MNKYDIVYIGAGPSILGAVSAHAISLKPQNTLKLLNITGDYCLNPSLVYSKNGAKDLRTGESRNQFGLPAVRAFGEGGSTRIWHGGHFVPNIHDEISSFNGNFNYKEQLTEFIRSIKFNEEEINSQLKFVDALANLECEELHDLHWRRLVLPKKQLLLNSLLQFNTTLRSSNFNTEISKSAVMSIEKKGKNNWLINIVDELGVKQISAQHIVLGAGCLSTLCLISRASEIPKINFNDHLHVFVGSISKKSISPILLKSIRQNHIELELEFKCKGVWKTEIFENSIHVADVSLSFRAVANPNFPRSGRKFGDFITSRNSNISAQISLALHNPVTAIEMLAFKYGVELPFDNLLVHATISPKQAIGYITQGNIVYEPPSEKLADYACLAFDEFLNNNNLYGCEYKKFDNKEISKSIISGAQFLAGSDQNDDFIKWTENNSSELKISDSSAIKYSSVYNQGLLSVVHGYFSNISS